MIFNISTATLFFLILATSFGIIIYKCLKRENSEIIRITNIDMVVTKKQRRRRNKNNHTTYNYNNKKFQYYTTFNAKNQEYKRLQIKGFSTYKKYNVGDVVVMQEIIYKNKNKIFTRIGYASNDEYNRLEEYKQSCHLKGVSYNENYEFIHNLTDPIDDFKNITIEDVLYNYYNNISNDLDIIQVIFIILFFVIFFTLYHL